MSSETSKDTGGMISLSHVIEQLREELGIAMKAGKGKSLRFEILETEIELSVAITHKLGGKLGVNFWVYTSEGNAGVDQLKTQKIRLKLKPAGGSDDDRLVNDDNVSPPTKRGRGPKKAS